MTRKVEGASRKMQVLQVNREAGKSDDRLMTDIAAQGLAGNALNAVTFSQFTLGGELSLTDMVLSLKESGAAVNGGDLAAAERMLYAQVVSLNAISAELARRAFLNIGQHLPAMESYLRLSLKAQAQCRVTVEALAEMKNPRPVAFVRQANIAHGPQQVNNGAATSAGSHFGTSTPASAHAGNSQPEQSKLLEVKNVERLDSGAPSAASATHPNVEPLGAVNRTDHSGG